MVGLYILMVGVIVALYVIANVLNDISKKL